MQVRCTGKWLVGFVGVLAVLAAAGEAAAQPDEVEGTCSNYRVFPTSATVSREGDSGTFDIIWDWEPPPIEGFCIGNCTYESCGDSTGRVRSSATWLSGTKRGSDQVDYTVEEHSGPSSRTGTLTVAGATFTVTQPEPPPPPCPPSPDRVSPNPVSFGGAGGTQEVTVNGRSDCSWMVSADQAWITTPASVSGGNTMEVEARWNPGEARSGTLTVGRRGVPVSQGELPTCTLSNLTVRPRSLSFGPSAGSADVEATVRLLPVLCRLDLSIDDGPTWISASVSATTPPSFPWPELTEVRVTVRIGVTEHTGSSARTGTVTIGDEIVNVRQCPVSPSNLSRRSLMFSAAGGTDGVRVTGSTGCSWPVSSDNQGWIGAGPSTVSTGQTVVSITVGPNDGSRTRFGTVTIGREIVNVVQCPSSPTRVSPPSLTFPAAGGTQGVTVTGESGCSWPVSSRESWIGASPSTVSAGGNVSVTLGPNNGSRKRPAA